MINRFTQASKFAHLLLGLLPLGIVVNAQTTNYDLQSPNGKIQIKIQANDRVTYGILVNSSPVVSNATLSLDVDHTILGVNPKVRSSKTNSVDRDIQCPSSAESIPHSRGIQRVTFGDGRQLRNRVPRVQRGVAYRFETSLPKPDVKIYNEDVSLNFNGDYSAYYPKEDSLFSHNEREFLYLALKDIPPTSIASLPAVIDTKTGVKLIIGESDVDDYPAYGCMAIATTAFQACFLAIL
jgi:alpha-glucosidase